ncbi:hypothetical protein B484DRAFT_436900, partial [Ochromonadaceae sp. CCMP2298]
MDGRKRAADGRAEERELALADAQERNTSLESQVAALQLQVASLHGDLQEAFSTIVAKDRALDEALQPSLPTNAEVTEQLDQLAHLAAVGLCAFSLDPLRAARPDLETVDQYTHEQFLQSATATDVLDLDDCRIFHRFVHGALSRARSMLLSHRALAHPQTRHVDPALAAHKAPRRSTRAEAMILQYAVEFVNPSFLSAASYIVGLNVRCMTKSSNAVDLIGRYLPGGASSSTFQRHMADLVEQQDDSKLDVPIAATVVF